MSEPSSRRSHLQTGESGRGPIPYPIASVARTFRLQWRSHHSFWQVTTNSVCTSDRTNCQTNENSTRIQRLRRL
ncbi:hypothetical protein [Microcoleus sp.]|uniref:hypothetical protein n=1 Tax=Microcoleus sp. TaxID=44472 RepID=UPI00403EB42E